jgi:hypothetical protein
MSTHAERVLDWEELRAIEQKFSGKGSEEKYFDAAWWLKRNWDEAVHLGLVGRPPLRILDLGAGAAHFGFVCSYLGHSVVNLDRPGVGAYEALCRWIGAEIIPHRIESMQRLPSFDDRFDLVTSFRIGFNTRADGALFDLSEWGFFLDDVRDNVLAEGGTLCLKMNRQPNRVGLKFGDPELMDYFSGRGARIAPKGRYVIFSPLR